MKNLNFETLAKRELSERELNSLSGGNFSKENNNSRVCHYFGRVLLQTVFVA